MVFCFFLLSARDSFPTSLFQRSALKRSFGSLPHYYSCSYSYWFISSLTLLEMFNKALLKAVSWKLRLDSVILTGSCKQKEKKEKGKKEKRKKNFKKESWHSLFATSLVSFSQSFCSSQVALLTNNPSTNKLQELGQKSKSKINQSWWDRKPNEPLVKRVLLCTLAWQMQKRKWFIPIASSPPSLFFWKSLFWRV